MSEDERLVNIVSVIGAAICWARWYTVHRRITTLGSRRAGRAVIYVAPLACTAILLALLLTAAAHDVRDDPGYVFFYQALGAAWVAAAAALMPLLGLSPRDDVAERRNRAAAYAVGGALVAFTLCYAGGNLGDGPGWWVVVFSALLATGGLVVAWALLERLAGVSEAVTVDRDEAAGLRLAGFLVAAGLVLGRAVAGDWHSVAATCRDFVALGAGPVLLLVAVAGGVEHGFRPTPVRPTPPVATHGALPALAYVGVAAAFVAYLGAWS